MTTTTRCSTVLACAAVSFWSLGGCQLNFPSASGPASSPAPATQPEGLTLIVPANGAMMDNGCQNQTDRITWDFDWSDQRGATAYHLFVMQRHATYPVIDESALSESSFRYDKVAYVIDANRRDWFWRVRAFVDGRWGEWGAERTFEVEPLDTDCQPCVPTPQTPAAGAVLDNGCRTQTDPIIWNFDWSDCPGAQAYHLFVTHRAAAIPVIDEPSLTESEYRYENIGYIVEANRTDWVWQVRVMVDGQWSEWSEEREFATEPLDADCP